MRLTANFVLDEFTRSQTAARHDIDMTPGPEILANLKRLTGEVLQPLRDHLRHPITISSGYRPPELNTRIGGSKTSAHMKGLAADFVVAGMGVYEAARRIDMLVDSHDLPVDQLIHEFGRWIHLGLAEDVPRLQRLTAVRHEGATAYVPGVHTVRRAKEILG